LQLEILALRHQLGMLQRSVKKPKLNRFDRMLWVKKALRQQACTQRGTWC
jgi:hypothetical protein